MKLRIITFVMAIILAVITAIPTVAATFEEWDLFSYLDNSIRVTMTINPTTLKTDHFDVYNNSAYGLHLYVRYNGNIVWEQNVSSNTNQQLNYTINFQRLPHNDPDNPDSIRYPNGYSFGSNLYIP